MCAFFRALALTESTGAAQTSYTFEPFGNTSHRGKHNEQLRLTCPLAPRTESYDTEIS